MAFELGMIRPKDDCANGLTDISTAGNRWHIDCFRCGTCATILDSNANILLLSDGSLICNDCTYNCSICTKKIDDLAILTGDQAFCASCFKCRNCKKKIENLKYARTSQGIFCMQCHESLMARRKKRALAQDPQSKLERRIRALAQDRQSELERRLQFSIINYQI